MAQPVLVVFKELVGGDLRKSKAEANNSPTGGGARDLRFRPYDGFDNAFERLFPSVKTVLRKRDGKRRNVEIRCGRLGWKDKTSGLIRTEEAIFEPPTSARPHEGRLTRVHKYPCLQGPHPQGEGRLVALLVLDSSGAVWIEVVTEGSLMNDGWHPDLAPRILACLNAARASKSVAQGYVDLRKKVGYCND